LIAGAVDRPLENITIEGLHVKMLAENKPDKRTTDAMTIERVNGLTLRGIEVEWAADETEPKWGSALVLRDIEALRMDGFRGRAGSRKEGIPAVQMERVKRAVEQ
jgi:hypothetical protein